MTSLVVSLLAVAGVVIVMGILARLAVRVRRNGGAGPAIGAAMAAYDEAMHSTAYDSFVEVQAQADLKIPVPAPDQL